MPMTKNKVVDITYARTKEYLEVLRRVEKEGKCPFCPDNFRYHPKPILKKTKKWFITKNTWPYKNAAYHFLIISKNHREKLQELSLGDWGEVHSLADWAIEKYKIAGGGLTVRFGDTKFTGATVCHLHFHLISPELNKKTKRGKTVYFPIG